MIPRIWFTLKIMLVFLVFGPPIGALTYTSLIGLWFGRTDPGGGLAVFAFLSIFGLPLSYLYGAAPALLTGLAMALWRLARGAIGWLEAVIIGLGAGVFMAFAGKAGVVEAASATSNAMALVTLTALVPAFACWWLACRLVAGFRRSEARLGF